MPVFKDPDGRRYVQAEVEVPGTPDEVWQAIATGPGISAWFVPTKLEEREGGTTTSDFGPGMESLAVITTWDPPHRFVADSRDDMGPDDPTVATEWTVEAKSGDTCIVRVVHSWFSDADTWDNQYEGHSFGWVAFFRILRLYLAHFAGQPSSAVQLAGFAPEPVSDAWEALSRPLGLADITVGQRVSAPAGAPPLGGTVENVGPAEWPEALVRLDEPGPGIAHIFPMAMGGPVFLSVRFFFYGDKSAVVAERAEAEWQPWMQTHFGMPDGAPAD
jgi:uncharacterized protein YndB with AHSA1/START domain